MGVSCLLLAALLPPFAASKVEPKRFAVIQDAPDFTLTTQDKKKLQFSKHQGKVRLVSFVFTTCNGSCPATTHRMSLIQHELKRRGLLKSKQIHLYSITLDPARDTPDVLRNYMRIYDADARSWTFLTGAADVVTKAFQSWGMWAKQADNGQLDHPSRIFLVDRRGRIREIYHLDFLKTPWVVEDIERLLKEK